MPSVRTTTTAVPSPPPIRPVSGSVSSPPIRPVSSSRSPAATVAATSRSSPPSPSAAAAAAATTPVLVPPPPAGLAGIVGPCLALIGGLLAGARTFTGSDRGGILGARLFALARLRLLLLLTRPPGDRGGILGARLVALAHRLLLLTRPPGDCSGVLGARLVALAHRLQLLGLSRLSGGRSALQVSLAPEAPARTTAPSGPVRRAIPIAIAVAGAGAVPVPSVLVGVGLDDLCRLVGRGAARARLVDLRRLVGRGGARARLVHGHLDDLRFVGGGAAALLLLLHRRGVAASGLHLLLLGLLLLGLLLLGLLAGLLRHHHRLVHGLLLLEATQLGGLAQGQGEEGCQGDKGEEGVEPLHGLDLGLRVGVGGG